MDRKDRITLSPRAQGRLQVLTQILAGLCSVEEAAQLLDLSVRHVWRLKRAYQQEGAAALVHGNRGKPSPTKIAPEVGERIVSLVQTAYAGCNDSHLVELLALREGIVIKRDALRRLLRGAGIGPVRTRRAPRHRRRRDRMPQAGMLLQIDASPHAWLQERGPQCALLGAIDDATGTVVAALFRPTEDAQGYLLLVQQILQHTGIPEAVYRDRHSIFAHVSPQPWTLQEQLAGGPEPTQVGRALEELGIVSIAARSPQAKGRIERLWGTLQDRLVAELRLAHLCTLEAANAFLPAFLTRFNARFTVRADDPGQAYRPVDPTQDLERVLSFRYRREVSNDNTVRLGGQVLQIPPGPGGRGYAKARVWVHELLDGRVGVWYNDQWLLRTPAPAVPPILRPRKKAVPAPAPARPVQLPLRTMLDRMRAAQPAGGHAWRRPGKGVHTTQDTRAELSSRKQAPLTESHSS
jgi:transposase